MKPTLIALTLLLWMPILGATVYTFPKAMRPFKILEATFHETIKEEGKEIVVITKGNYFAHASQFHLERTYHLGSGLDFNEFWIFVHDKKTPSKISVWNFSGIEAQPDTYIGEWDKPQRKLVMTKTGGSGFKKDQIRMVEIVLPTQKGNHPRFNHKPERQEQPAEQNAAEQPATAAQSKSK